MQHGQGLFVRRPALDRRVSSCRALLDVAVVERLQSLVHERFGFALPLGLRAAGAVDVGPGAIVGAIEEQHARPDVDRLVEPAGEILVEPRHQQLLDAALPLDVRQRLGGRARPWRRVRHACKSRRV